jgi:hypothetical protein
MSKRGRDPVGCPGPYRCLYAPECAGEEFCEVHLARVGPCSSTPRPANCR